MMARQSRSTTSGEETAMTTVYAGAMSTASTTVPIGSGKARGNPAGRAIPAGAEVGATEDGALVVGAIVGVVVAADVASGFVEVATVAGRGELEHATSPATTTTMPTRFRAKDGPYEPPPASTTTAH